MSNIIVLLQLALSLLSNPQVQANPQTMAQVNVFVGQAISLATEALKTPEPVTPWIAPSQPAQAPVSTGGVSNDTVYVPPVIKSCALTLDHYTNESGYVKTIINWTSENVSLPGKLYVTDAYGNPGNLKEPVYLNTATGTYTGYQTLLGYMADFNGVTCKAMNP